MNRYFDAHFQKEVVTIHPGEYYSSTEDIYIATVLGSCISIALYEQELRLGGINHFMLPRSAHQKKIEPEEAGRFGDFAIELLIADLMKKGVKRILDLQAKVFGGGNVLQETSTYKNMTGINNIDFALKYLETERIPVLVNDTGGIFPRKIYFHPLTSKTYVKRIRNIHASVNQIQKREEEYEKSLKEMQDKAGSITWF